MPGHNLCRPTQVGLMLLALILFVLNIKPAEAANSNPLVLELTDRALTEELWALLYTDSLCPMGEFQVLLTEGPEIWPEGQEPEGEAFLLLNGTEIGRIDRAEWQRIATHSLKTKEEGWISSIQGADRQEVPLLWKAVKLNPETLLKWVEWPSGLLLGMGTHVSSLPTAKPQVQRDLYLAWSQKLFTHFLLGLELHRSQFGGGLTYAALEEQRRLNQGSNNNQASGALTTIKEGNYWGEGYWWWSLSAGIPGIKYTLSLANQPLPKYFWLETRATKAIKTHKPGRIIKQWTDSTLEKTGNFAHTVDARLGYLRYGIHFDSDAYRFPIQNIYLDDLPALFGTWGGGLLMASDLMATRVWMNMPDLGLTLSRPSAYPSDFKFVFLRLDLAYRTNRNFNLGISVRIHIDNPILNLPGA